MSVLGKEYLKIGQVLKAGWGGMYDFYEIKKFTNKTVTLIPLLWETCKTPEGEHDADPVHHWTKILKNADGSFQRKNISIRKKLTTYEDGTWEIKSPNYQGDAFISPCDSEYQLMYWG